MTRVVGTDPGSSSLDMLLLVDGEVADQARLSPEEVRRDPGSAIAILQGWGPLDLVAGPSGYGLPLVLASEISADDLDRMTLGRRREGDADVGILGFRALVRAFAGSNLPVWFLPGGIHLHSIPSHRKANAIDMGTADKVAVAALAAWVDSRDRPGRSSGSAFALLEVGSVFAAVLVIDDGRMVDAAAGTRGPIGLGSGGAWDGEVACWRSPLSKDDLFRGGVGDLGPDGPAAFRESLTKHLAGLRAVTPFNRIYVSGSGAIRPEIAPEVEAALRGLGRSIPLPSLPGAWVKHAAQGAAILADGLAGGRFSSLVESFRIRECSGSLGDFLRP